MIILAATDSIQLTTDAAVDVHWTTCWKDENGRANVESGVISAVDTTPVVTAKSSNSAWPFEITHLAIVNTDAATSVNVTVERDTGSSTYQLLPTISLSAQTGLIYDSGHGWEVI